MVSNLIKRILVPYDGSKFSKKALNSALEMSDKKNSEIFLISVVNVDFIQPPGSLLGMVSSSSVKAINRLTSKVKKETSEMLLKKVSECKSKGIRANYKVTSGNVSEEILKYVNQKKITLVVIGSKGLHGISKIKALGSTSRKVSEFAKCPVMIIR
jgi:nucleotide-binding universal stress UspA family protein